jgi:hypothetical protein
VTPDAEFVPGLENVSFVIGGVGIVALDAIPLDDDLMAADRLFGNDIRVAIETDRVRRFPEELAMGSGMGVVTSRAFTRLHGGVNERALQLVLKVGMAAQTQLPRGFGFELELVLSVSDRHPEEHR